MLKQKQEIRDIETLTEDELLDILYVEYVRESIRRGEEDIKNGRIYTFEEIKEFIDKLGDNYENSNI
ncbi:MAG: hypothetical protein E7311_01425 [Clostridiales bacterium]|nr:hypothetical protein [Clostridiales bacterium]